MWRPATPNDDDAIVAMCTALNAEDPGTAPVPPTHTRRTLGRLRAEPARGRAVVLDLGGGPVGYALLISFWSNELGGEVCTVDELYVAAGHRGRGHAGDLVQKLERQSDLWSDGAVALQLEVSPRNARARALYTRLGFAPIRNATMRKVLGPTPSSSLEPSLP
jgi:GNAT superfamily N-acetyltransferase